MKHYRISLIFILITILILSICIWNLKARQSTAVQAEKKSSFDPAGNPRTPPPQQDLPDAFNDAVASNMATLSIQSLIGSDTRQRNSPVFPASSDKVLLKIEPTSGDSVRWYQIFPDLTKMYNNAYWPNEPKAYQWKGIDEISYLRSEIKEFRNRYTVTLYLDGRFQYRLPENAVTGSGYFQKNVGSFWFQVEVLKDGKISRSPGIEDKTSQGLSPEVFRVTLRGQGDDYLSHLIGFFNVPGIFGSTIGQSTNYVGVDCADVLMAAYAEWKNSPNEKNYNVAMLVDRFPKVDEFNIQDGRADKTVTWNQTIRPGDFIAVRYSGGRSYQHIGALYDDKNQNGILDAADWVLHAGPSPLHLSALKNGNFNGHVVILRPE